MKNKILGTLDSILSAFTYFKTSVITDFYAFKDIIDSKQYVKTYVSSPVYINSIKYKSPDSHFIRHFSIIRDQESNKKDKIQIQYLGKKVTLNKLESQDRDITSSKHGTLYKIPSDIIRKKSLEEDQEYAIFIPANGIIRDDLVNFSNQTIFEGSHGHIKSINFQHRNPVNLELMIIPTIACFPLNLIALTLRFVGSIVGGVFSQLLGKKLSSASQYLTKDIYKQAKKDGSITQTKSEYYKDASKEFLGTTLNFLGKGLSMIGAKINQTCNLGSAILTAPNIPILALTSLEPRYTFNQARVTLDHIKDCGKDMTNAHIKIEKNIPENTLTYGYYSDNLKTKTCLRDSGNKINKPAHYKSKPEYTEEENLRPDKTPTKENLKQMNPNI